MADPVYQPFLGDISTYGSGPEHQFFLWDAAAQAANPAPGSVPTPTPRPAGISAAPMIPKDTRDGSEYGGGAYGIRNRDVSEMRSGVAPLSARGIGVALGNAMGVASPIMTTARMALSNATGMGLGGWQDVPGQTPFDADLKDAVGAGRMTRAQAVAVQGQRNQDRGRQGWGGNGLGFGGAYGRSGGEGYAGGAGGGRGDLSRDPTPGTAGRADGGRIGYGYGGLTSAVRSMFQRPMMAPRGPGIGNQIIDPRFASSRMQEPAPGWTPPAAFGKRPLGISPGGINPMLMADGGDVGISGAVDSPTPGRADAVDASAPDGSYVIPADVVSALGDGNSDAGHQIIDQAIQGLMAQQGGGGQMPMMGGQGMARGGVPIRVSGGEHIIPGHAVHAYGRGSHAHGARKLDAMIHQIRQRTATKLRRLPPPR